MDRAWWSLQRRDDAALGFTARDGGYSTGDFQGLNLGAHVGDDAETVERNRAEVLDTLARMSGARALRPVFMNQVHGAEVRVITEVAQLDEPTPATDGVVTTLPDVALFTLVADCVPILLYDNAAGVIAAAHAGRAGMVAGVVRATVNAMREVGAASIEAVVGPAVCGRCYEVPEHMRAEAAAAEPVSAAVSWTGTAAIDVAAGVVEQLHREGISLSWLPGCTKETDRLFSHRRDGRTGRSAGVIARVQRRD